MKKSKVLMMLLLLVMLCIPIIAVQDCNKQDVITTLKITQTTLDVLYKGTVKPLVKQYCNIIGASHEHNIVCDEFEEVIDPATEEFLSKTFPSLIIIAEIVIPEGTQPSDGEDVAKAFMRIYYELPEVQQVKIREEIMSK